MSLPIVKAEGTHYEVGFKVGTAMRDSIQKEFRNSEYLRGEVLPFLETENGQRLYDGLLSTGKEWYPQYVEELQGIADGSGVEFRHIFAMNIEQEVEIARREINPAKFVVGGQRDGHCTTVILNSKSQVAIGHNEDAIAEYNGLCYIVDARYTNSSPRGRLTVPEEHLTAFCYPGYLPGLAFSFLSTGLVTTVNTLYPHVIRYDGLAYIFMTRAMVSARNQEEFENILRAEGKGTSVGFSVCVVYPESETLYNYEISMESKTADCARVQRTSIGREGTHETCDFPKTFWHVNRYIRTDGIEQDESLSSISRGKRLGELPPPNTVDDIRNTLSDTKYHDKPIYRMHGNSPYDTTLATAIYNITEGILELHVSTPANKNTPLHIFKLPHQKPVVTDQ